MGDFFAALWDVVSADTTYSNAAVVAALLLFAACGEFPAERAGTINISLEGMMLGGAFAAAVGFDLSVSVSVGLLMAIVAGAAVAWVQANMSHRLTADQFVVGLVINTLVLGIVGFLTSELDPGTISVKKAEIPLLVDIPKLGPALFNQRWPFYLIYLVVPLVWWLVYRTRWGLELRAIGEDPNAADVSGLHVNKRRRESIYLCGAISGLGGGYFVYNTTLFEDSLIGGRGYIALAAVIFGGWTLKGTVFGCVLFGTVSSFILVLPGLGYDVIDPTLLDMAPALVTLVVMAVFANRVHAPAALARPFIRGLK